jgi:hypothetical protein
MPSFGEDKSEMRSSPCVRSLLDWWLAWVAMQQRAWLVWLVDGRLIKWLNEMDDCHNNIVSPKQAFISHKHASHLKQPRDECGHCSRSPFTAVIYVFIVCMRVVGVAVPQA